MKLGALPRMCDNDALTRAREIAESVFPAPATKPWSDSFRLNQQTRQDRLTEQVACFGRASYAQGKIDGRAEGALDAASEGE